MHYAGTLVTALMHGFHAAYEVLLIVGNALRNCIVACVAAHTHWCWPGRSCSLRSVQAIDHIQRQATSVYLCLRVIHPPALSIRQQANTKLKHVLDFFARGAFAVSRPEV